jgi:sec-independent protein translocase protein TatB
MFDIGFWELTVIAVVALLVIGPERLPRVARTTGMWIGKARRFVSTVKADIDRELAADELKRTLAKQAESTGLHEIIEETKKLVQEDDDLSQRVEEAAEALLNKSNETSDTSSQQQTEEAISSKSNDADGQ